MVKQIVADTFETLGQTAKQAGQQMAQEPKKAVESMSGQMAGEQAGTGGQAAEKKADPVQQALNRQATQKRLIYLQDELAALRKKRAQEAQATEVAQVQQEKKGIQQLEVEKKKEEVPLAIQQAKAKAGTKERKLMGVSG